MVLNNSCLAPVDISLSVALSVSSLFLVPPIPHAISPSANSHCPHSFSFSFCSLQLSLSHLSLLASLITGRSCQSVCMPAASGGGDTGEGFSGRRANSGTDLTDWRREKPSWFPRKWNQIHCAQCRNLQCIKKQHPTSSPLFLSHWSAIN